MKRDGPWIDRNGGKMEALKHMMNCFYNTLANVHALSNTEHHTHRNLGHTKAWSEYGVQKPMKQNI